jgi:hypothetical protein
MRHSQHESHRSVPLKEILKTIPGFFGIRLEEAPRYEVLYSEDQVEIRKYGPMVLAQVTVDGEYDQYSHRAFRTLADYIFGENSDDEKISMTNPILQEKAEKQIPMSAPLFQEKSVSGWTMSFVLPAEFSLKNAPKPTNPQIRLKQRPEKLVAVWSYSGNNTPEKIQEAKNELTQWLQKHPSFHAKSHFWWAQYDAPVTIPFLKKNEMHIWVEESSRA